MATDEFGGILVEDQPATDEFGGIPVDDTSYVPTGDLSSGRGGVGRDVPLSEAKGIVARRMVKREREAGRKGLALKSELGMIEPGDDEGVVHLGRTSGLIGRGYLAGQKFASGMTGGLGGAALTLLEEAAVKSGLMTPEQQMAAGIKTLEQENPLLALSSETAGQVAAGGKVSATAYGGKLMQSGALGGLYGAAAMGSQPIIEKGFEADPMDVAMKTAIGAGIGVPTGMIGAAAISPIKTAEHFGLRAKVSDLAEDIFKPTTLVAKEKFITNLESGDLEKTLREIKKEGVPKNLNMAVINAGKTKERLGQEIGEFISKNSDVTVDGSEGMARAIQNIQAQELLSPEAKALLIEKVQKDYGEVLGKTLSLKQVQSKLRAFNAQDKAFFKRTEMNRSQAIANDPEFAARSELRQFLSEKMDDIITTKTGDPENFYRRYGKVSEVEEMLERRMNDLKVKRGQQVSEGIWKEGFQDIHLLKPGTYTKPVEYVRGGDLGKTDRDVQKLFKRLGERTTPEKGTELMATIDGKEYMVTFDRKSGKDFRVRTKDGKLKLVDPVQIRPGGPIPEGIPTIEDLKERGMMGRKEAAESEQLARSERVSGKVLEVDRIKRERLQQSAELESGRERYMSKLAPPPSPLSQVLERPTTLEQTTPSAYIESMVNPPKTYEQMQGEIGDVISRSRSAREAAEAASKEATRQSRYETTKMHEVERQRLGREIEGNMQNQMLEEGQLKQLQKELDKLDAQSKYEKSKMTESERQRLGREIEQNFREQEMQEAQRQAVMKLMTEGRQAPNPIPYY